MQLLIRIESSTISKDIRRHRFLVPHCHDEKSHSRSECAHLSSSEAETASVPYLFHPQKEINCSQRTLYNYINQRHFPAVNLDLPRKVSYKPREQLSQDLHSPRPHYWPITSIVQQEPV